ncbi:Uncharacterized protein Fot_05948 [Forsythia ovata]|uniref:Uncharacterized protein n=1 Tax=Forsythia ovata TaxID=205694 RepID=A0ABD1WRJ8_9LAMI
MIQSISTGKVSPANKSQIFSPQPATGDSTVSKPVIFSPSPLSICDLQPTQSPVNLLSSSLCSRTPDSKSMASGRDLQTVLDEASISRSLLHYLFNLSTQWTQVINLSFLRTAAV